MRRLVKTTKEIDLMREGGKVLAEIMSDLSKRIEIGVTTADLDRYAQELCDKNNVEPAFLGYQGYTAVLCTGVNDTVVHGIPNEKEVLSDGDIVSVDMGIIYHELYLDMARTFMIGEMNSRERSFVNTVQRSLEKAIGIVKEGATVGDIGHAIESTVKEHGYSVVKQMVGHGIGRNLHEDPQIPGFGNPGSGMELKEGMTIAIESIINEGDPEIVFLEDRWTTKTADGKLSALFENTVLVCKHKGEILTKCL